MFYKRIFRAVFLSTLFFLTVAFTHKFYIATTQINYVPHKKSLRIIQRVFTDDLEKEMRVELGKNIELGTERTPRNIKQLYKKYLNAHLKFFIGSDTAQKFDFIGVEYEGDQTVFYIEITGVATIEKLTFQNTMLIGIFEDQQHIVTTKINGVKKSFILTSKKITAKI